MVMFVGSLSKILDVPQYKIRETKLSISHEIATMKLVTSLEFRNHEEQIKLKKEAKLEKQLISKEQKLSKALVKKEKEKVAQVKKVKKEIDTVVKKRCYMRSTKGSMATKNEFPHVLSKQHRTFVTPFTSQDVSNSLEVTVTGQNQVNNYFEGLLTQVFRVRDGLK